MFIGMTALTDSEIEQRLGLTTSERAAVLEVWHRTFDERLRVSHGDYDHAIQQANYYAWRFRKPRREQFEACGCPRRRVTAKRDLCPGCKAFNAAYFWWEDANPAFAGTGL